ncbi:tripartite tricarboxylate transporter substrate binding protein BugE [Pigmentiphaga soli]|uniref:Tripartite tricarboxylate transporter substrate binding protein BugE n=1 Tax=Pigmentiphaga soli TaxID=1007095 RepID=A0ABP8HER8_9BURK
MRGLAAAIAGTASISGAALAQAPQPAAYPAQTVRIVVPFAPGGATDYIARLVAQRLTQRLGQSFVVENRAGAGGVVGAEAALRAPPDGGTILVASASYAVNPALMKLSFDPIRDARPVINMVFAPSVFTVTAGMPIKTLGELVAYAKANPGKLAYATQGMGSITHVSTESFLNTTGVRMIHVPYRGMGPALTAIAAGEVQVLISDPGAAQPVAATGKIRLLAVAGERRLEQFPDVPTVGEAGFPQLANYGSWQGMFVPRGTPQAIVETLNRQVNDILRSADVQQELGKRFATPLGGTPEEFAQRVSADIERYGALVRKMNIKAE